MNALPLTDDGATRRQILIVLFIGVFMAALDAAVIAPAIPALRAAFGVDNSQIGLVTIIFVLSSLSSTALMASLSDRYGRRPIYLTNVALFALGSLTIALAPNFVIVLLGRAIQGFSAGGLTPTASAVIGDVFPVEQRGKALGLIGATFGMAFLLGPLLASLILLALSWQWIFLLNLPIAALILVLGARALPTSKAEGTQPPFDWAGLGVTTTLLTSMTLGINRVLDRLLAVRAWPWLLLLALLCLPVLFRVERRAARPLLPPRLFATRQLVLTYVLTLGAGFGMSSVIFITSVAVAAFGIAAQQAGFLLLPLVIFSSGGSMLFGRLLNQLGSRMVMLVGFATLVAGCGLLGFFPTQFWIFMLATLLIGLGVGIVVGGALRYIVLNEVPAADRGAAQGLINIGTSIGTLLVVAILGAVADSRGGGLPGLALAYLVAAGIMLLMLLLTLGLKSRSEEQEAVGETGVRSQESGERMQNVEYRM